eukprot:CAMPEP_0206137710 /NCGR_PEP_ID=MMETSP1473-20131121/2779_1 /ASSEMBLY_ACC=CAM_ASM_001109 /TAXON_ID=1461547 /ORGANISM="Stichococcus sp, Strain RCC1054" /LENGTH=220 /DNA_ID=CAMNT_0053530915 /DNA_START=224 /DNA_END=884 /DNA_ORIENTATION=-
MLHCDDLRLGLDSDPEEGFELQPTQVVGDAVQQAVAAAIEDGTLVGSLWDWHANVYTLVAITGGGPLLAGPLDLVGRNVWAEHHLQRVLPASGPHHHHRVPAAQGSAVGGPSGRLIRRALSPISGSSPLLCLNMKLVFDFSQGPPLREPPPAADVHAAVPMLDFSHSASGPYYDHGVPKFRGSSVDSAPADAALTILGAGWLESARELVMMVDHAEIPSA